MILRLFSRKTGAIIGFSAIAAGSFGLIFIPSLVQRAASEELTAQVPPIPTEDLNRIRNVRPSPQLPSPTKNASTSLLDLSPAQAESAQSAEAQSTPSWLLQRGPLGLENGLWLDIVSLACAIPLLSLLLYLIIFENKSSKAESRVERNPSRSRESYVTDPLQDAKNRKLEESITFLSSELDALKSLYNSSARTSSSQEANTIDKYVSSSQSPSLNHSSIQPPPFPAPLQFSPSPAQVMADLTAAINRGDRQSLKGEIRAQLNITRESDSAILMSKVDNTQLEVVTAGGSYFMVSIGGDNWLYPTELTLRGYAAEQPSKGIFNYTRQQISQPQVIMPARLSQNGAVWSIVEMGNIGVPA
jgi:hypothetical protein